MFNEHLFDRHTRELCLFGDVDESMAHNCWLAFHSLRGTAPITIYLDSDGGDVESGLFIFDTITKCPARVKIHVLSKCYSMAVAILQAGDERTAEDNAFVMIHCGTRGYPDGPDNDTRSAFLQDELAGARYNNIIYDRMKAADARFSKQRYQSMLNKGHYWDKPRAQQLGLLDV